ncbi:hypothetical protein K7W42_03300 [Deinococcus sp. HMF7604]|uniref:hypothetical protein n=1 Tax=Deinococcus betulae TaxID=2873312 RepID=UPI001CCE7507|nr:hypothetical protein [Deinococcus betulae]MBZ9749885.1 hypothetical protein [Deinococcus betulae]
MTCPQRSFLTLAVLLSACTAQAGGAEPRTPFAVLRRAGLSETPRFEQARASFTVWRWSSQPPLFLLASSEATQPSSAGQLRAFEVWGNLRPQESTSSVLTALTQAATALGAGCLGHLPPAPLLTALKQAPTLPVGWSRQWPGGWSLTVQAGATAGERQVKVAGKLAAHRKPSCDMPTT